MGEISFTKESLVDGVSPCGTSVFQRYENAIDQLCHDASRVTAGVTLDADTVTGYGIGIVSLPQMSGSVDNYVKGGIYFDPGNLTNSPWGVIPSIIIIGGNIGTILAFQLAFRINLNQMRIRILYGSWQAWESVWSPSSDGNAGQPPAPKPTTGTPAGGANAPGQALSQSIGAGSTVYYSGASNLAGTWKIWCMVRITASNLVDWANTGFGIGSGAFIASVPAGETAYIWTERQA